MCISISQGDFDSHKMVAPNYMKELQTFCRNASHIHHGKENMGMDGDMAASTAMSLS